MKGATMMVDSNIQPSQYRSITNKEICCKREMRQIDKDTFVCDNCYGKLTTVRTFSGTEEQP